jgi:glutamyl-tRNA synthetase
MISENIRVRFAPSPTGYLHIGGLRTALYNYLIAKHNNGTFVLRIEDTDRNRYVEGAVENLIDTLNWAGLEYDEGPVKGGEYGPYLQSQRLNLYRDSIINLLNDRKAYHCFCSQERLKEVRVRFEKMGMQPMYDKNCLHLSDEEIKDNLAKNLPYVIRLNVQPEQQILLNDVIRGEVVFNSTIVDDQILIKSDGYPTYHLANVVDDHYMKITHVVRGEEWLSSTPKHILLYEYFGWEKPEFAHLPLLLNPDKSKLSKRQGDVAVEDYRSKGYLKEALINFVALLGWNFADDKEFYLMDELIEKFTLEGVNKAGAVFNIEKLNWLNAEHLRKKPIPELTGLLREELKKTKYSSGEYTDEYLGLVIEAMKERVSFIKEIPEKGFYFFEEPETYEEDTVKKRWKPDSAELLRKLSDEFSKLSNPAKEDYENTLRQTAESAGAGTGKLIHPVRLAVSGVGGGPGVFDILYIIGKEKTIKRLNKAIEKLG